MARQLSAPLEALLAANNALVMADLYVFDSPVLGIARYTSWGADVTYSGDAYTAGGVVLTRDRVRSKLGLNIDQLDIEVGHGGSALYGATPITWSSAALSGALDGAGVKLYRAFFKPTVAPWAPSTAYSIGASVTNDMGRVYMCGAAGTSASSGGPTGSTAIVGDSGTWLHDGSVEWYYYGAAGTLTLVDAVLLFGGYVGEITPRSTAVALTVESLAAKLNLQWPHGLFTPGCRWDLYSDGCGLTRPTTWDAEATAAGSTTTVIVISGHGSEAGFAGGSLTITAPDSSVLKGMSRAIVKTRANSGNLLVTIAPALPSAPVDGLTVKLVKGCLRTAAACETTFNNLDHFSGEPVVPPDSVRDRR